MSKSKRKKTGRIVTLVGIAAVIAIAVILIFNITHGKNGAKKATNALGTGIIDETDEDVIPYGDNDSDSHDFSGDYFDTATQNGTMTITKDGQVYSVNITYAETDDSVSIWTMTAAYDKNRKALFYRDCVRTDYVSGSDDDSGMEGSEQYTEGSGYIYLSSGKLFWIDNKEDMGTGLLFENTAEIGQETEKEPEEEAEEEAE